MNAARWERVQHIVSEALELPAPARHAFVDSQSSGDTELRAEVRSLLDAASVDDLPSGWLDTLAEPEGDRFAPGDLLAGRYRITQLIGRGGMGEVYEACDEELGITVALKTLRELGSHASAFEHLKLEGMLARSVWHPNVCRVYEVGRHGELCFLAMERLHGRTLQERLRAEGPIPLEHALRMAREVAAGLGAAHRAGVVHRDLKPANVMLVGEERAVVMDFGTGSGGRSRGMVAGTPAYMAPEQFRGEEVGPAADVYALGLLLCEMVTGTLPQVDALPEIAPLWDTVIRRCLDPDPRRRFARAEDVFAAFTGRVPVERLAPVSTWPAELDPFVGRTSDLEDVSRALSEGARLLTLVGPGGMGKTRLAIRYGRGTTSPGGAFFCDLTEARGADGIASAVGNALGVQLGRGDAIGQLAHAIAGRGACLLVLDNFEQVVAHAADTVGRWQSSAPEATFVVTSRARLGLEGERTHEVAPLSADEALGLFALRARGLRPGFELSDESAAREIVRLLDGIPLAIELAAARIRVMTVEQILQAMQKRFQLLAGGSGARHETLEGTIDESWELLAPWERAAFSQCTVFEGGCTLEAAAGVLDLGPWPEAPPIVDVVGALVDKSLLRSWAPLRAGESAPEVRFGMYVSLQEYARKRLHAAPDAERSAEARHGIFYAAYGGRFERELDNLVAACRRAIARGDGHVIAATYRAAWQVLRAKGPLGTALTLGSEALADVRLKEEDRAIVEFGLGEANFYAGRCEDARIHCAAAMAIARQCGAASLEARAGAMRGRSEFVLDKVDDARASFDAALAVARRIGDAPSLSAALNGMGMMQHELGHTEEARLAYEEALAITRAFGDRVQEAITLLSLGILQHKRGHLEEAGDLFDGALAIYRETGNRRSEGIALLNLGSLRSDQGRMAEARQHAEAALAITRAIGARLSEGIALIVLGELHSEMEEVDEARAWLEPALTLHRELGDRRTEGIILGDLARLHELREETEAARAGYEAALAIHREVGDRHYEGAALTSLAAVLLARGSHAEAREALALAEPILRAVEAGHELVRMHCVRAELEQALGNVESARAALAEGEALVAGSRGRPGNEVERALARARRALAGSGVV